MKRVAVVLLIIVVAVSWAYLTPPQGGFGVAFAFEEAGGAGGG